jgi:DNA-binding MarR family transcriptional regulator
VSGSSRSAAAGSVLGSTFGQFRSDHRMWGSL